MPKTIIRLKKHLNKIIHLLNANDNFSISRFGDGEIRIINRVPTNISGKKEFNYNPAKNEEFRLRLLESFSSKLEKYYVGIPCNCCANDSTVEYCIKYVHSNLTFANMFVNINFPRIREVIGSFGDRDIYLVCSSRANTDSLPFEVKHKFICSDDVMNDLSLVNKIKSYIDSNKIENSLFLFCAGPLSNILSYELFKHNNNNTYIDFGSVLDQYFYGKNTRKYHSKGHKNLQKNCHINK